jgi:6-phosphogluconate dehydrogenase
LAGIIYFMSNAQFGMIGLGTMGRNFLLNAAEHGFSCIGYDKDASKQQLLITESGNYDVSAAASIEEFVAGLAQPRNIMMLVPAGPIVDAVIGELLPLLSAGDLIIDGGNSHFTDTEVRQKYLDEKGLKFLGVGVSGGEEGARHGASIMIGGDAEVYKRIQPLLEAVSAKVDGEPCAAHVGNGSAGHFVKMVHNGIEYGLMQLIAETFDIMQRGLGMNYKEIRDVFVEWNKGELNSFLIEITGIVLRKTDDDTGKNLVDIILDTAGQKGTGKWTSQAAMDFGVPIPTIDSAVTMRQLSAMKAERVGASSQQSAISSKEIDRSSFTIDHLKSALHFSFITTYAQGMSLLKIASAEKDFGVDLEQVAKIWRGGCIIRAALLKDIRAAFAANKDLANLMLDKKFAAMLAEDRNTLRGAVTASANAAFPSYCMMSCLAYYDAYHSRRLPANLIQAQRDFFGAHTYQLIDKDGNFHNPDWNK